MSKYPYISKNKCLYCNEDITIKRKRDENNQYCSTRCVGKHLRQKKEKSICKNCGNEFKNRSGEKNIFCSRKCQLDYRANNKIIYERICKGCGKKFYPKQITYSRPNAIYCSPSCINNRKYNFDFNYFDNIDNEEKAYWLGFIYADGNVYKSTFTLKLNNKDTEHLKLFNQCLNSEYPLKNVEKTKISLNISSVKLCERLNEIGVMPRKTFIIEIPDLRKDLYNDFIRGFFDGDGCIYIGKTKNKCFSIYCASDLFRKSIIKYFIDELNITLHEYGKSISCTRKSEILTIHDFLYDKENLIYLNRKKEKFNKLINL